jgi:hypothetical protein
VMVPVVVVGEGVTGTTGATGDSGSGTPPRSAWHAARKVVRTSAVTTRQTVLSRRDRFIGVPFRVQFPPSFMEAEITS